MKSPWIAAINRLLRAELRRNPRPKPNTPVDEKYWNNEDLAAAANIRPNTLSDVMRGKREPSVGTLLAIAEALRVHPSTLLMDADEAMAYVQFQQSTASAAQSVAVTAAIDRVLEERADQMKAEWIAMQRAAVIAELSTPTPVVSAPHAQKRKTR